MQHEAVARHTRSSRPASAARDSKRRAVDSKELGGVEPLGAHRQPALVGPREHQQVLGQLDQAVALAGRGRHRLAQLLGRAALAERQLELRLEQRQRGAQLVTRAGHEAALALGRLLQPLEHLVERRAELRELVAGGRHGQPPAAAQPRDLRGLLRIAPTGRSAAVASQ